MPSRSDEFRSTAAIGGHPIHPLLVPFPIAFLVGAFLTDLVFWQSADPFWARGSEWLLGAGIVMGALAAIAGLTDFLTISRARSLTAGWVHFLGNAAALLIALWNLLRRTGGDPGAAVVPNGIILSAIVVAIFLVTGWLGGELVFRHRIGVVGEDHEPVPSALGTPAAGIDLNYAGGRGPGAPNADENATRHQS